MTSRERVAYVGHSFRVALGAKLAAVKKRIDSFVLMAGAFSNREYIFDEQNEEMLALRQKEGDERHPQLLPEVPVGRPRAFRAALFAGTDLSAVRRP